MTNEEQERVINEIQKMIGSCIYDTANPHYALPDNCTRKEVFESVIAAASYALLEAGRYPGEKPNSVMVGLLEVITTVKYHLELMCNAQSN